MSALWPNNSTPKYISSRVPNRRMHKLSCFCSMEYYIEMKMDRLWLHAITWMNNIKIILSKRSQIWKTTIVWCHLHKVQRRTKLISSDRYQDSCYLLWGRWCLGGTWGRFRDAENILFLIWLAVTWVSSFHEGFRVHLIQGIHMTCDPMYIILQLEKCYCCTHLLMSP